MARHGGEFRRIDPAVTVKITLHPVRPVLPKLVSTRLNPALDAASRFVSPGLVVEIVHAHGRHPTDSEVVGIQIVAIHTAAPVFPRPA